MCTDIKQMGRALITTYTHILARRMGNPKREEEDIDAEETDMSQRFENMNSNDFL